MPFHAPPAFAAWRHQDTRDGFEVAFVNTDGGGWRVNGSTTAVEDGEPWVVEYSIGLTPGWTARSARVVGRSTAGEHEVSLAGDGAGHWEINGVVTHALDGCLDVDLESSAVTNAFPVHRLGLQLGEGAEAPAVYVRARDLAVERLEQRYVRLDDNEEHEQRYGYSAPRFGFECELLYDAYGLVLAYPGIAVRTA
jgi:hypothetical protein